MRVKHYIYIKFIFADLLHFSDPENAAFINCDIKFQILTNFSITGGFGSF